MATNPEAHEKTFHQKPSDGKEGGSCGERQAEVGRLEAGGQGGRG